MTNWRKLMERLGDDRSIRIRRHGDKALELRVVDDDPNGHRASHAVTLQAIEHAAVDVIEFSVEELIKKLDDAALPH